jgi:hypothetical protein
VAEALVPRGWRYADHIRYDTPGSLDELHGPITGTVEVQGHIDTSLKPIYDLADPLRRWSLYTRVVRSGTAVEQAAFLDRATLVELWPSLILPERCRAAWVGKFPELAVAMRQSA